MITWVQNQDPTATEEYYFWNSSHTANPLHVQTRHPTPKIGRQSERLRGEWSKQASKKGSKHEGQQASQQASEASKQERTDARQGQQAVQHASGAKSNRAGEQARSKQASKKGRNTRATSRPARQQASKQASTEGGKQARTHSWWQARSWDMTVWGMNVLSSFFTWVTTVVNTQMKTWQLGKSLLACPFGSVVWELSLGIFRLIYSAWFGIFRLESFVWDPSLGNFCLGSLGLGDWSPEAGGTGWLTLGETGGDRIPWPCLWDIE